MGASIIALEKDRLLNESDKHKLGLDDKNAYAIRFLFNDKLNQATDPGPFRINEKFADKLAKKVIGMPWITPPNTKKHIKSASQHDEQYADPQELLTYQTQYSVGTFVSTIKNDETNNYYGIVKLKPEYVDDFSNGRMPEYTSITLGNPEYHDDGSIINADFLNLQTVDYPGYSPHLASIKGVCSAGLHECINELAVLGAAGTNIGSDSFSNILSKVNKVMSAQTPSDSGAAIPTEDIAKAVEVVKSEIEELKKKEETLEAVTVKIATAAEGVDETKIKEELGVEGASTSDAGPAVPEITGAAGKAVQETISQLKKEYDRKFALLEKERDDARMSERHTTVEYIVDRKIALGAIASDDREAKIKSFYNLKDSQGNYVDLDLLASELKDINPQPKEEVVGASGFRLNLDGHKGTPESFTRAASRLFKGAKQ